MTRRLLAIFHHGWRSRRSITWKMCLGLPLILLLLFLGSAGLFPAIAQLPSIVRQTVANPSLEQQARQQYEAENFTDAIALWQQLAKQYSASGDTSGEAMALSNLSLTYQQLGQWKAANDAIVTSLNLLTNPEKRPQASSSLSALLAQTLEIKGRLQLAKGQAEAALETWQQAAKIYTQLNDTVKLTQNHINQAQALQATGNYRQAQKLLQAVTPTLQTTPNSLLKATGLRSLGNLLRATGDLDASRQVLQQSLAVAQTLSNPQATADALLSLGNTVRAGGNFQTSIENTSTDAEEQAKQDFQAARDAYQQAATIATNPLTRVQAQLNQFSLLIDWGQWNAAIALQPQIQSQLDGLPPSHATVYATVNYIKYLLKLNTQLPQQTNWQEAAKRLATAAQQAHQLDDPQAEAYALGMLGTLYEQNQQIPEAQQLTDRALKLSQAMETSDSRYRWQWQRGRLLWERGDVEGAIAAYNSAIQTLQSLRSDMAAMNPETQFSFRDDVEPVYRQFVELLLQPDDPSQANLKQARQTIELLQLAELDNFLRQACLQPRKELDAIVQQEAVFYPIILKQHLEVIVKLPGQKDLHHYPIPVTQAELEDKLDTLRKNLRRSYALKTIQETSRQLYDWLIRPVEADLVNSQAKTLVFVLDGNLRSIPMAVLYDGHQYLIEKYSLALTPGLQLTNPKPLQQVPLNALAAGVSQARPPRFWGLPNVPIELKNIQATIPTHVLLNQQFTAQQLQTQINSQPFSVVHLATHGQFGATAAQTFVLAWDKLITINELSNLLQAKDGLDETAIELLVLSACQTAIGDKRAVLGIAGVAVRAGARSTVASLWKLNDDSATILMNQFYRAIADRQMTKAEALRQAQLALLKRPGYEHPNVWAPYVLVGNWQ